MSAPPTRILIVEDEVRIADLLVAAFERRGYACEVARDGPAGLEAGRRGEHDLVVLDLMLPGMDGTSVCRSLRAESDVPILMLTARDSEADKVLGLELGADDYVTKPFSLAELEARVRSLLRRAGLGRDRQERDDVLDRGRLRIDTARRAVEVEGTPVELTATEFDLLAYMATQPGRVFTREQLLENVWGYDFTGYGRTVDSHVTRLRKKLEADPSHPTHLLTVWGVGYRFETGR